ncbi:hypothetical protein SAMN06297144_1684 [Sphingomonas guangdongensis]|uniref:General secretion pathway protein N n=1 Tax=Sphingomonas guangdongensis TaxID=1141890 RepID=A0A285QYN5_9SPHN|nr:hypothetical protein [Sphingomonas guangdongensis]SOB86578.1 hypothetical protein SAMN06297144_1684 [Sphingomonas guangdongensis]
MIATIPAGVIVKRGDWRTGVGGTIWNGEVGLAGGSRLEWHWAPLRSLINLAFAADWRATGSGTNLGGRALLGPSTTTIDAMSGSADGTLLQAIQPDLPFTCDLPLQLEFPRAKLDGSGQLVEGTLTSEAGSCAPKGNGVPTPVPALILSAEHVGTESRLRLAPATQRRRTLMTITLGEDGAVDVRMTPEGAAALPFVGLPPGGSIKGQI